MLSTLLRSKHEVPAKTPGPTAVVKVVELVGTSPVGFEEAIRGAVKKAAGSLRHITGVDVKHMTAAVKDGQITEYRVDLKIAFALDDEDDDRD